MSYSELTKSDLVAVYDVTCHAPRSGFEIKDVTTVTEVVLLRRGVFVIDTCGQEVLAHVGCALVLGPHQEFRVAHPGHDGDVYTLVRGDEVLVEEALGSVRCEARRLTAQQQLAAGLFTNSLRSSRWDQLEAEEMALLLLASVAGAFNSDRGPEVKPISSRRSARVERARALLAAAPTQRWRLDGVAREVACSPFHLARDFRSVTGETIGAYLLRLRLGIAIDHLADGEGNLAALAVETGFAHHSHFTSRFHRAFGLRPIDACGVMTRRRVDALRELLATQRTA